ncbi:hypothetical protein F7R91_30995 [Streptomyces luteolifulvus]|uniref:Uncharacterized protein n=1 Tax=Streptomyces luteolifulvus TaxID=2615112 RepID=A0A6H9UUR5_9ACTN|nr:hypothetical protein F7R91_30995 [Streptomyces luteolifulvus]
MSTTCTTATAVITRIERELRTDSGLALDLPPRLLDREFGQGKVVRFEDVDFPMTLTHEPTRRFLSETGLPEDSFLFHLDTDLPLPTLAEYCTEADWVTELPDRPDHLIRLGNLTEDNSLVVDGTTGAILAWSEPEAILHPLTTDISMLAFALWLLQPETDDDNVDELFMFHNGTRFWPPSGIFSMTKDTEAFVNQVFEFGADAEMRFSLRDDESPLGSDSLGFVDISRTESNGEHTGDFEGGEGGSYTLTYRVGDLDL